MKQESTQATSVNALNRAKMYQLVLFPMNNGATNVYYILTMNFIAYYANGVLGLLLAFATTMVTLMRAGDAFIDPIIGAIMDRTSTKWGKFRPFMVIGNLIMIVSSILLYFGTRIISEDMMWLRYLCFILFYALNMVGYTFQTSVTRSGQTCLTNDPKQRPLFTIFNTIASLIGMGLVQFLAPIVTGGNYRTEEFFNIMIPLAMIVSAIMTALAVIGIAEKDRPEFFGLGGEGGKEKVKIKEYVAILKANKELQRLMIAGAGCKLAFSIATNMTVLAMLYGAMMGDYKGLYLPMMIVGYVFSVPFFLLTVRTSQKKGQKASLMLYQRCTCYVHRCFSIASVVETGSCSDESESDKPESLYDSVYPFLRNRIRSILCNSRYADSNGCRLFRLRNIPFRTLYSGNYRNLILTCG